MLTLNKKVSKVLIIFGYFISFDTSLEKKCHLNKYYINQFQCVKILNNTNHIKIDIFYHFQQSSAYFIIIYCGFYECRFEIQFYILYRHILFITKLEYQIQQLVMKQECQQKRNVTFIHFNDVYDIESDSKNKFGFVNFYDAYLKLKQKYPSAITVFSGDAFAPSKLSRIHKGWQMVHCLKLLNIDIACYGNHQFDFTPEHSLELAKQCNFPWLLSNVKYVHTENNLGGGLDYFIMQKSGIKIGFLGLVGPDFKGRLISCYKNILTYQNHIEKAKVLCKKLREDGCTLIVAVTHMRMGPDQQLAKSVPQIDLILGGHDHFVVCKITNKIPIIKSGKNFENIGLYHVANTFQVQNKEFKPYQGRRWSFIFNCMNVEKTSNKYPQLENYIKQVVQQYNQRGLSKNIKKVQIKKSPIKYENQWKFSYGLMNGKSTLQIDSISESQICFAKYICFQKGAYYVGNPQSHQARKINVNQLCQSIKFVCNQIKRHSKKGGICLYSQGYACIPYIVQCCNFAYLPKQLSCKFKKINELQQIILRACSLGMDGYAVIRYVQDYENVRKKDNFSVLFKFREIPPLYLDTLKQNDSVLLSFNIVYENQPHTIKLKQNKIDILIQIPEIIWNVYNQQFNYSNYFHKCRKYFKFMKQNISDLEITQQNIQMQIKKIIQSLKLSNENKQVLKNRLQLNQLNLQKQQQVRISKNSQRIQITIKEVPQVSSQFMNSFIAMGMARQHMKLNRKGEAEGLWKGIVFNEGNVSYPTYQLAYGYLPLLFSVDQTNTNNKCKLFQLLEEKQLQLQKWFNVRQQHVSQYFSQKTYKNIIYDLMGQSSKLANQVVIKNKRRKLKTAEHITKYAKSSYSDIKTLSLQDFLHVILQLQKYICSQSI